MIERRRQRAARTHGRALIPKFGKRPLPQVFLYETRRNLPKVYHPEPGDSGAGSRLKWLASTCIAGVVGVGVIGATIYGSMDMDDGTGVVNAIKRASLAAMEPERTAERVKDKQTVARHKGDRIQTSALGLSTKHIIHDNVVQRRGGREFITIKPYARIVARLATAQPEDDHIIPPFNPFKLYANTTPIAQNGADAKSGDVQHAVFVKMVDLTGGYLPQEDGKELRSDQVAQIVAQAQGLAALAPFAMRTSIMPEAGGAHVQQAAFSPDQPVTEALESEAPLNTTIIEKKVAETEEDEVLESSEIKVVKVRRGDTLMGVLKDAGAEKWQAKAIAEAMAPVFSARSLQAGHEVRFTLVPAPSDTSQMEPIKVSVFNRRGAHVVTAARNNAGDYVASDDAIDATALARLQNAKSPKRATLYTSFYHSALSQGLTPETVLKLLRVHSYDVDFKRRARPGESFEVFFDLHKDEHGRETKPGEMLYTAMTVDGAQRSFYRFRTPDGVVDFYDADGNSAKKFLMRKPVKGARFTSAFGMRKHPLLRYRRMHTGVDWAAPRGTPILAAGSGTIEAVGRKGGYGNYVRIRHANGFKTAYSHMHRFARGLRPGVKVRQGQIIGYVGSTGLSSGPHLHYEVLVNNRYVNPMKIHVPRGHKLTGPLLTAFHKERLRIDQLMRRSPVTTQVAALDQ